MSQFPQFSQGENLLSASLLNRMVKMLQWYEGQYRKLEVKKPERYERKDRPGFWAIIIGSQLETPNRWRYSWLEAEKAGVGYDGWGPRPDGRQGIVGDDRAYHLTEDQNDGSGVEGNGVNVSNLPGTFSLRPVPPGAIVRMWTVTAPPLEPEGPLRTEHWFAYGNAIDGTC